MYQRCGFMDGHGGVNCGSNEWAQKMGLTQQAPAFLHVVWFYRNMLLRYKPFGSSRIQLCI